MSGVTGEDRVVLLVLVGLILAAGVLLWWQGQDRRERLEWVGAVGAVRPDEAAGAESSGVAAAVSGRDEDEEEGVKEGEEGETHEIVVHVAGCVVRPGVYSLPAGSRMIDAVKVAGGVTAEADTNAVNLARLIGDGEQVYVPSRQETARLGSSAGLPTSGGSAAVGWAAGTVPSGGALTVKLDLNTATQAQLEALPGIGPALAARIIQYRQEHGPFRTPEELLNVSGIGEKKLAEIRPYITVR
ncbi:MAG: ComEA family DNA-binding protein [Firmicutes bacterium]|nr:ComEA family DNA-binding protein [Bacillota bacterium]